jgi:SAM-dependent MidA family methyltransferase
METALYHPSYGYYTSGVSRWGRAGDYRTLAESIPLYGVFWARFFEKCRRDSLVDPTEPWQVIELGNGHLKFANSCLTSLRVQAPESFQSIRYHVIDLQSGQMEEGADCEIAERIYADWPEPADSKYTVVFSNELFDALPVHRMLFQKGEFYELYVSSEADSFVFLTGPPSSAELIGYCDQLPDVADGTEFEVNLDARVMLQKISGFTTYGIVVTVDYGTSSRVNEQSSLRSITRHRFANDVLRDPGMQDLTSDVRWPDLIRWGDEIGLGTVWFGPLNKLLTENGIVELLEKLNSDQAMPESELARHLIAARELVLPGGMANSFQVLIQKPIET